MDFSDVIPGLALVALGIVCAVAPKWIVGIKVRMLKKLGAKLVPSKKLYGIYKIIGAIIALIGALIVYRNA